MVQVFIKNLGCKSNAYDGQVLATRFMEAGWNLCEGPRDAQVIVINTCCVTQSAEKDTRYLIRRYRKESPHALIVIAGCHAQIAPRELSRLEGVDAVIPNESKEDLVPRVLKLFEDRPTERSAAIINDGLNLVQYNSDQVFFGCSTPQQTRAFVKIQDGCNNFCSYCIVPYTRGQSRSVPVSDILAEIQAITQKNIWEVVLTGIHVGDYRPSLTHLLSKILQETNLKRLRISSLECGEVTQELFRLLAKHADVVCPHFHIPLQSGSARILKMMNRTYDPQQYAASIALVRNSFPHANIGADVIVGFPGETDDEFAQTRELVTRCLLNGLHVFSFSRRSGTPAATMPNQVPVETIKKRSDELRRLSIKLQKEYIARFLGTRHEVLWEDSTDKHGRRLGTTRNYITIALDGSPDRQSPGSLSDVILSQTLSGAVVLGSPILYD